MPADALAAIAKDHIARGVSCGVFPDSQHRCRRAAQSRVARLSSALQRERRPSSRANNAVWN
jgi:hypothetical protein